MQRGGVWEQETFQSLLEQRIGVGFFLLVECGGEGNEQGWE